MSHNTLVFEVHCVDHCTRACRQCNHFTPYAQVFNGPKEYRAEVYFPYIDRLVELDRKPERICVIGGEPFIHSDLRGFVLSLKERYGVSIQVTTNGFWLADEVRQHERVLEVIDCLTISLYPDEVGKIGGWEDKIGTVRRCFPEMVVESRWARDMYVVDFVRWPMAMPSDCFALSCPCLRPDGKLYRCSTAGYAEWSPCVTKEFMELRGEMALDLNRDTLDVKGWMEKGCVEACRYCTVPRQVRMETQSDPDFFLRFREAYKGKEVNPFSVLRRWEGVCP